MTDYITDYIIIRFMILQYQYNKIGRIDKYKLGKYRIGKYEYLQILKKVASIMI